MIYFVQPVDGGHIKIGTTVRLTERLRALSRDFGKELRVLAVTDGSYDQEKALHRRFAHLNVVNELFEPGDDLLGFIVAEGREWDGEDDVPPVRHARIELPDDVYERLKRMADRSLLSISAYIRQAVLARIAEDEEQARRGR